MSDVPNPPPAGPPGSAPTPPPQASPTPPPPAPSTPTPPPYTGVPAQAATGALTKDETNMALLIHVLAIFTGFLGPLIIWLMKKDESPFIDRHGKTALNFTITVMIGFIVSAVLFLVLIGILTFLALLVASIVLPIMAAMKANSGEEYTYPLSIKFFS